MRLLCEGWDPHTRLGDAHGSRCLSDVSENCGIGVIVFQYHESFDRIDESFLYEKLRDGSPRLAEKTDDSDCFGLGGSIGIFLEIIIIVSTLGQVVEREERTRVPCEGGESFNKIGGGTSMNSRLRVSTSLGHYCGNAESECGVHTRERNECVQMISHWLLRANVESCE